MVVNGNVSIITITGKYLDWVLVRCNSNFDAMCVFVKNSTPRTGAIQAG
jgi:hypothetical protein